MRGGKGRASPRPSSRVSPFERDRDRPKLLIADSLKGAGEVPRCGTNDEVLSAHRLDAASVAERVQAQLGVRA